MYLKSDFFEMQSSKAQILFGDGVVVFDILNQKETLETQKRINSEILNGPELTEDLDKNIHVSKLVGGGFGALGSPSSFHAPSIRRLRYKIHTHLEKSGFYQEFSELCGLSR